MRKLLVAITCVIAVSHGLPALAGVDCYRNKSDNCVDEPARALPTSVEEYLKLREELGKTPQGGAALLAYALMVRVSNKELGEQLLVVALDRSRLGKGGTYKGYAIDQSTQYLIHQLDKHSYCARSYADGSSPDNDYKLDPASVGLKFRKQTKYVGSIESGRYKVFLCSTGTDTCRPITLQRNDQGIWKAREFSTIVVGCRAPSGGSGKPEGKSEAKDEL
jgi:hypothetical protein